MVSVVDVGRSATKSAIKVAVGNADVGEEPISAIKVSAVDVGRSATRFAIRVKIAPVPVGVGNADVGEAPASAIKVGSLDVGRSATRSVIKVEIAPAGTGTSCCFEERCANDCGVRDTIVGAERKDGDAAAIGDAAIGADRTGIGASKSSRASDSMRCSSW